MVAPHVEATFEVIEAHLRGKGHQARVARAGSSLELASNGVMIRAADSGIEVRAEHASGFIAVVAALADLEIHQRDRRAVLDDIRHALGWLEIPERQHGSTRLQLEPSDCLGGLDCLDCFQVVELFDGCDLGCL